MTGLNDLFVLGWGVFTLTSCIEDKSEHDEAEADDIKLRAMRSY